MKICIECKNPYQNTNNIQKVCVLCRPEYVWKRNTEARLKKKKEKKPRGQRKPYFYEVDKSKIRQYLTDEKGLIIGYQVKKDVTNY